MIPEFGDFQPVPPTGTEKEMKYALMSNRQDEAHHIPIPFIMTIKRDDRPPQPP
ncbi:hypothetical protein [Methanofollis formosanus]|uniref:hypothetical protein n=1 Tax=Methanofollis formosanus TaxID=299308 RepID=UPI001C7D4864|nr:hypothetical protein [Methanofollis formosanus]